MWLLFVVLYGIFKGSRELLKKKAIKISGVTETLFVYTFISFIMVIPEIGDAVKIQSPVFLLYIAFKSFVIYLAWICGFKAVNQMPVSLYGVLDMSRVLFSTGIGILVFGETLSLTHAVGFLLVCLGLILMKTGRKSTINEQVQTKYIVLAFLSCGLNGVSGAMDKLLMRTGKLTSSQLQFWYMLFLVLFYVIHILITKTKIDFRRSLKNYRIYIMALIFVIGDKLLFIANQDPNSTVTLMILLKQSGCIVTILGGRFFFKEKNITKKLLCDAIIIAGIVIAAI